MRINKVTILVIILVILTQTLAFADTSVNKADWGVQFDYNKDDINRITLVIALELGVGIHSDEYTTVNELLLKTLDKTGDLKVIEDVITNNDWMSVEAEAYHLEIFYTTNEKQYFFKYFYQDNRINLYVNNKLEKLFDTDESVFSIEETRIRREAFINEIYEKAIVENPKIKQLNKDDIYATIREGLLYADKETYSQILGNLNNMVEKYEKGDI